MLFEVVEIAANVSSVTLGTVVRTEDVCNALVLMLPLQCCPAQDVRNVGIVCIEFGHGSAPR